MPKLEITEPGVYTSDGTLRCSNCGRPVLSGDLALINVEGFTLCGCDKEQWETALVENAVFIAIRHKHSTEKWEAHVVAKVQDLMVYWR